MATYSKDTSTSKAGNSSILEGSRSSECFNGGFCVRRPFKKIWGRRRSAPDISGGNFKKEKSYFSKINEIIRGGLP
jgi:hypothetical protein